MPADKAVEPTFRGFLDEVENRLRYALVAAFGPDRGLEAAADALSYAWEHWERIEAMENPAGYVYRVGERIAMQRPRSEPVMFPAVTSELPDVEPGLPRALDSLSEKQRAAVVLVHGFGVPYRAVANLLGISAGSVQSHVQRGLAKLRRDLGVEIDA